METVQESIFYSIINIMVQDKLKGTKEYILLC